jgi:tRNA(fMet)-specific endonuclease VapC
VTLSYLLDTSIVSSPISKTPHPEIVRRLSQHGPSCAIGAPVWHELVYGCRRLPGGKRRLALEAYLEEVIRAAFPILPYDEPAAAWHAAERARLDGLGKPASHVDGQIAAIAHVNGLALVTTNTRDFLRFKDVRIENWSAREAGHRRSP